ncbi:M42 family metallopeptidase [Carnobacterium sp.]|uniref:M42 family metallopeptidase n=1 Tax=Carnobacterium sp. TaxID=48221 RepID=UPI0028B06EE6|nr:M42 family metallopeptidase [Carnobacterium sp.]
MDEKDLKMLKELTDAKGVPGNEKQVREVFVRYAEKSADSITYDGLGSVIAKHVGDKTGPKVLFAGHLDEVGFMVTAITDEGFIKFQTLGGWWSQVMLAQQVEITTAHNKVLHGVIGCKPPHVLTADVRNKAYDIQDMFIDIGASSKEEALSWGVKPGDMVTPYIEFKRLNDSKFLLAKAWDNRIGTAVALKVLENIAEEGHPNKAFSVGNVQEEVGLRGAKTATYTVDPDIAFALVAHKGLRDFVVGVAEELDIPFQYTVIAGGGTDAGSQHVTRNGIPSLAITVATRYLHSHTSVIHEDDYLNTVKLVTEVVKRLDSKTVEKIRMN